ncbi:MAG: hypothetical protein QXF16_08420 [Metallosphaera sp.]
MIEKDIQDLASRLGMSPEEIKQKVTETASTKFASIEDEDKRFQQAFIYVRAKLLSKPVGRDKQVIVYGLKEPVRSATKKVSKVYVLTKGVNDKYQRTVMLFQEEMADMYKYAELFTAYTVNVIDGKQILMPTPSTKFVNGKQVPPDKVISILKQEKFVEFNINDAYDYLSAKQGKYVDEFDIRATRAIVIRANSKRDSDGNIVSAVYELADPDNPDATISAWVPPPLFKYADGSELYVYGVLQTDKNGIAQLTIQGIKPIVSLPLEV